MLLRRQVSALYVQLFINTARTVLLMTKPKKEFHVLLLLTGTHFPYSFRILRTVGLELPTCDRSVPSHVISAKNTSVQTYMETNQKLQRHKIFRLSFRLLQVVLH